LTDIAPLGFAIDTSGLKAGKAGLEEFRKAGDGAANAVDRIRQAHILELRALRDSTDATARLTTAKLNVLRTTEGVKDSVLKEAKALADVANQASAAARAKFELAKAGGNVQEAMAGVSRSGGVTMGVLQGVAREASAMAANMGMGSVGGRLGVAGAMGATQSAATRLASTLGTLGGPMGKVAAGTIALTAGYTALTASLADNQDKFASYTQQLATSLGDHGTAVAGLNKVVDLANEVGISVDSALTSFNRFARARESMGATNEELLTMTETIMKLGRSGGTAAGEMQTAMMQLSQSLASGRLNGDELRSIMENMPVLAKAIAAGMDIDIGKLRTMGAAGDLTGEKVFRAILSQSGKAQAQFEAMPKTVEMAKIKMSNEFDELASHIGHTLGASQMIRGGINALTGAMDSMNKAFRDDAILTTTSRIKALDEAQKKAAKSVGTYLEEANKQFNKDVSKSRQLDKDLKENEQKAKDAQTVLQQAQTLSLAAAMRVTTSRPEMEALINTGRRGSAFEKGALAKLDQLGLKEFTDNEGKIAKAKADLTDLAAIHAEIVRQQEQLARNDPFEKLTQDVADWKEALEAGSGGMVQMRLEAMAMARETGKSVDEIIRLKQQLDSLKTEDEVRGKEFSARSQNELARQLAGGANQMTAESAAEAAEWAFQKFGDQVGQNTAIVNRYTNALVALKQATQALGDATELTRLKNQIEELKGTLGLSGFDQRLATFNIGIDQFRRDRAGQTAPAMGGAPSAAGGSTSNEAFINALMWAESRGRDYRSPGVPLTSSAGAMFSMQVLPSTAAKPGYGIAPARSQTAAEYNRVGKELATALLNKYGDPLQAAAAYHSGPGNIGNLGPAGRQYVNSIASRLGLASGGAGVGAGTDLSGQIISGRTDLFNLQEQSRAQGVMDAANDRFGDAADRIQASGNPAMLRELELQIKVREAIKEVAPQYRAEVELAIRDADAKEKQADAAERIAQATQANDNQERRNGALASGSPARVRQLELELRIEEIRRNSPPGQAAGEIAEARRADALNRAEGLARMSGDITKQTMQMKLQADLIGKISDEERVQAKLNETKVQLFMAGEDLTSQAAQNILAQAEAAERLNIALDKQLEQWNAIKSTGRETAEAIGQSFGQFFATMTRTGEMKWKTMMGAIEEAFYTALDRMVQQFVISPIVDLLSKGLTAGLNALFGGGNNLMTNNGSTAPITWTANGNVFGSNEGLVPFAAGDIFNAPSRFLFGGGRQGMAGEGPGVYEGIMPLKRGADGRLGVAASGGGGSSKTEINVYDQRAAGNSEAVEIEERKTGDGMRQVNIMVRDAVRGHMQKGSFDSDQRAVYGNRRQVQRR
jgi:tape measure domain-containing protein